MHAYKSNKKDNNKDNDNDDNDATIEDYQLMQFINTLKKDNNNESDHNDYGSDKPWGYKT